MDQFLELDCFCWTKDIFLLKKPKKDHNELIFANNKISLFLIERRYLNLSEDMKFIDFCLQASFKSNEKPKRSIFFFVLNYYDLILILLIVLCSIFSFTIPWESELGYNIMMNLHMIIERIQLNHVISYTHISSSDCFHYHLRVSIIFRFIKRFKYFKIFLWWDAICVIQKLVSTIFITLA